MKTLFFATLFFIPGCVLGQWMEVGAGGSALNANNSIWNVCADTGKIIYAAGGFSTGSTYFDGSAAVAMWNGVAWTMLPFGTDASPITGGVNDICVDGNHDLYAAVSLNTSPFKYYVAKWESGAWLELGSGATALNANHPISTVCTDLLGNIYAAGDFTDGDSAYVGHYYVAKWDGISWSMLGSGTSALNPNDDILSIASDKFGNIYAAGDFRNGSGYHYVAKWNGTTWSQLGSLDANGTIWTIHCDKDGNIYAGGFFENSFGKSYVAKWDGSAWSELGGINSLHSDGDILTISSDRVGNIYVGGTFGDSGKAYVAKWNGTNWSSVGSGSNGLNANGEIFSVCTDAENNVYAAGLFTNGITSADGHSYVAEYSLAANNISVATIGNIKLYPVPSTSMLHVESLNKIKYAEFSIYDMSGRLIKTGSLVNGAIDIANIGPGCFALHVFDADGQMLSTTFNKY